MEFHEAANLFPLLIGDEYRIFRDDIATRGLLEPIILCDNKILDGRNRHIACLELGITPQYTEYSGDDPVAFVISKNLMRRHLNETQRAVIANRLANMPLGGAIYRSANLPTDSISQPKAAEMLNVSERTVRSVAAVEREMPELLPQMESGEMSAHEAEKQVKEKKRQTLIDEIEQTITIIPDGLFDVIVIDPPWPYGTKYDADGRRAANPYPEQSIEDISKMVIPAAANCVLWLWTTHKFMRYSFELLDAWGFRDVAIATWVKDRMGLGQWLRSQTEFCIMAVKGKPNLPTVKKGNVGERLVKVYLKSRGFIPYIPDADGAHPFDLLVASKDKKMIFIADSKAKPARTYYPDTGINIKHYEEYRSIEDEHNFSVFLFFIDEDAERVYGNFLSKLREPITILHNWINLNYPLFQNGIVYFPLVSMINIGIIPPNELEELCRYSTRNHVYAPVQQESDKT